MHGVQFSECAIIRISACVRVDELVNWREYELVNVCDVRISVRECKSMYF